MFYFADLGNRSKDLCEILHLDKILVYKFLIKITPLSGNACIG